MSCKWPANLAALANVWARVSFTDLLLAHITGRIYLTFRLICSKLLAIARRFVVAGAAEGGGWARRVEELACR